MSNFIPNCPLRQKTRIVNIGDIAIGGGNPIRIQSMTTTPTRDANATVQQCITLAETDCEIIRITAPTVQDAAILKEIHKKFRAAGFTQPLVADIHFSPAAAIEAIEHVEKIRINPGNFFEKKLPAGQTFTDKEYDIALEKLREAMTPLITRAKTLGRALRIGVNHGSLSERILQRHGDTPEGMLNSAREFINICESLDFHDIVLSFKASNPNVMIDVNRLYANDTGHAYPLHLGVTEAGEGEDGRIKSAIGIGTLLAEGIGDTIRVSLTEDPWLEVPFAKKLVQYTENFTKISQQNTPLKITKTPANKMALMPDFYAGDTFPPRVIIPAKYELHNYKNIAREVIDTHTQQKEIRAEGLLVRLEAPRDLQFLTPLAQILTLTIKTFFIEIPDKMTPADFKDFEWHFPNRPILIVKENLDEWLSFSEKTNTILAIDTDDEKIEKLAQKITSANAQRLILTATAPAKKQNSIENYLSIANTLTNFHIPIWLRATRENTNITRNFPSENDTDTPENDAKNDTDFTIIEKSIFLGAILHHNIGSFISIENDTDFATSLKLAYDILQGARARSSKTEFVACPSCGRTLFDIQNTTQKIKARLGHLKNVTVAVMGCIVNGPGEMADADFGYVGGAPGKINLYIRKECVKTGIPQSEAVEELITLIKQHGKWTEN